jgi:proline dehydrogenase
MFRQTILAVASNPVVSSVVQRYGMQLGASRFVAGETLDEAVEATRALNRRGLKVTLDHLGESVRDQAEANTARDSYLQILDAINLHGIDSNVSLKLTMMGAGIDPDLGYRNTRQVVERAAMLGNFVRIDMEDTPYTDMTLDIYRRLWEEFPGQVGVVLQAYLYRTPDDLKALADQSRNFRIVKGAYLEPASVAYPSKADVDDAYVRLVQTSLVDGHYTAIASHDEEILGKLLRWIQREQVPTDRFEFQMLYGIKESALVQLAREGYRCRVYVPYGRDWYAYFSRRLAERPANLLFFARALVRR